MFQNHHSKNYPDTFLKEILTTFNPSKLTFRNDIFITCTQNKYSFKPLHIHELKIETSSIDVLQKILNHVTPTDTFTLETKPSIFRDYTINKVLSRHKFRSFKVILKNLDDIAYGIIKKLPYKFIVITTQS